MTTRLLVADLITLRPRQAYGTPADYDELENDGNRILRAEGVEVSGSRRLKMSGGDAVEVSGRRGDQEYSIRLLYRGRRRFEFRCLAPASAQGWPCESAFASFEIADLPEEPAASDTPHVLHLRDERFGIEFDAPDDSWLAIGPRTGGGGSQVVWIWRSARAQVDVQAFDLSVVPGKPRDQAAFATAIAAEYRANGAVVKIEKATLAGAPCEHLLLDLPDGNRQDMFTLNQGNANYSLLVTQPIRNEALVNKLRQGFKLKSK